MTEEGRGAGGEKPTTIEVGRVSAVVGFLVCCWWGDKMSRWSTFYPSILSSSVLTFPCPLIEPPDLDRKFDREQTSHDPFQYRHLHRSRGKKKKKSPATSLQWGEEHSREKCHLLIKGCSRFFLRARGSLEHCPISAQIVTHLGDVFYLGAAGPCATQAAQAHAATSTVLWRKDLLSFS